MTVNYKHVIKRDGTIEHMRFDKISDRIIELSQGLDIDPAEITQSLISILKSGMTTYEIDIEASEIAVSKSTYNPDYGVIAKRLLISNIHKMTSGNYETVLNLLYNNKDSTGVINRLLHPDVYSFAVKYLSELEKVIDYSRDYSYSYFALKTLERSYLLKDSINFRVIERPQHMLMRVALGIHYPREEEYKKTENSLELEKNALKRVLKTYEALSKKKFTHASPTLFNSGTLTPQFSSCFLLSMEDDLKHIYNTIGECAIISKYSGGLAVNISNVRCRGSLIRGTNGESNGVTPMLKVLEATTRYVNQGGKRNGSTAIYLEMWHGDIEEFLKLRLNDGNQEEVRCTNLFTATWIPDIFMRRVKNGEMWSLMCPSKVKGLVDTFGEEFEKIYLKAEEEGKVISKVPAKDIWKSMVTSQILNGGPYTLYKDHVNNKSNQKNIGTIKGSNLCAEILEYTDGENIAVCNLTSISFPYFVQNGKFNYDEFKEVVEICVENLNRIVDYGFIPSEKARITNSKQRAIGIGCQGLQECLYELRFPWESENTKEFNRELFEKMYYYAINKSADLAREEGSYYYFEGSPISQGLLQTDLWKETPKSNLDWDGLREKVKGGIRNSLLIALMPTASTSAIMDNTESFEPATNNVYTRKTLAGEFIKTNSYLYQDLSKLGLWNDVMVNKILLNNGSIQNIPEIPTELKELYKTVWEIKQKTLVDLSADRGPFVCQTQSLNIHLERPTIASLSSLHMYTWTKGLKTGSYYMRSQPAMDAVKFTINKGIKEVICTDEVCVSCSG